MPEIRGAVDILRPVEDVFAFLSEPENNLQWETGLVEMKKTTEGPLAVGSKGRRVEKLFGTDEGTWEITEHVPNESLGMTFESQRIVGTAGYKLESTDGGTRLNYWFTGNFKKILFKLLMPLMMPMFRRQVRKDYAKLKGILES